MLFGGSLQLCLWFGLVLWMVVAVFVGGRFWCCLSCYVTVFTFECLCLVGVVTFDS